jgi:hypothetical protein
MKGSLIIGKVTADRERLLAQAGSNFRALLDSVMHADAAIVNNFSG